MFYTFLILISVSNVRFFYAQKLPYGDDYNGTHVLVDNRYFPVVDCQYENSSDTDTHSFPIPVINYTETLSQQSLFDRYKQRYACVNVNPKCDCSTDLKLTMGYTCKCPYKTSFFLRYFVDKTRTFVGKCEEFSTQCAKCNVINTVKCIILNSTTVRCQCIKGYEPNSNCYLKSDACSTAPAASSLSGNAACMVSDNNKCLASLGFQNYICQCFYPNKEDYNLGFPNCMGKKVKKCDSILCVNGGVCDPTSTTQCKCPKGFSGVHCEITQYLYIGSWSPWTSCYPECGNYGLRSSDAVCDGSRLIFCSGVIKKWQRCSAVSCRLKFLSAVQNKTIRGLRNHLAQMVSLSKHESIILFYILSFGGLATGLLYIFITELIG